MRRIAVAAAMLSLGIASTAPAGAQSDAPRKTLAPGAWIGGGVGFSTIQSPADFANGIGFNVLGGWTRADGLGLVGEGLFTVHPRPGTFFNSFSNMSYVSLRAGPRYTLNPRARTTPFIQVNALVTRRSYTDGATDSPRSRVGGGGGVEIGFTGATSIVRVEFGAALDLYRLGDEKENGVISNEEFAPAFSGRQLNLRLSFLFPLSTY